MSIDVLIVGGGPVGMTLGAELARYGVKVRIVHRTSQELRQEPNKTKPVFLWSRTLELLDRSGSAAKLVAAGQKLTGANIVADGKSIGHIDFTLVNSPHRYLLTLPQDDTERFLEQHLNRLGVQVERGSSFISLSHGGGALNWSSGLKAVIGHADGGHEIVEAQWLVGCDGIQSGVRKYMEMPLQGGSRESDWAMADVHLSGIGLNPSEFTTFWHPDGVLAIFPIQQGAYRIIADLGKGPGLWPQDPTMEQIQALLDQRGPGGLTVSDPLWLSAFRASDKKVRNYQMGRVFLSGDAAYAYSPMGGQGLNMGMQDAVNLAWKLALVVKGICPEQKLLPSYNVERSAANAQVTGTIARLTAAANVRNQPIQTIRNLLGGALLGLLPTRRVMQDSLAEISGGYAHSPLNGPEERAFPGPGPGDRMPPVAGEVPVGAGDVPRFALYADPSPEIDALLQIHADLLEPKLRAPLSLHCVWLVRPDGYVAAVSLDLDVKLIADYLSDLKEA
jgi:2-polyprenyl-6-methoxyphenol hydroxylase-like FAD-dependent oxidoreductase